jgi:hypothetical protein
MLKKTSNNESNSLKTFYLYAVLVIVIIVISLVVKGFLLFQQNKFDPSHHFILAITKQGMVKEIIAFHPQTPSIAVLLIQDKNIAYSTLAKNYGISADGYIQRDDISAPSTDITGLLWSSLVRSAMIQTDLTIFDTMRLMLLSKSVPTNNKAVETIMLAKLSAAQSTLMDQSLTDQDIATESISIQIVNATGVSGVGLRLGKVLTSLGANVVDISTSQKVQSKSTIAYFGERSYTLQRLEKMLAITATQFSKQQIANIVITIGSDKQNTTAF